MQYSIITFSKVLASPDFRIDAEYWHPETTNIIKKINSNKTLGDLIDYGYRVVYENTNVFRSGEAERKNFPKFIQAADIDFPMINIDMAGYVHENEWERYPKGRIKKGEVLVEVKGNVNKVAIVPDNFTEKALISGTLYKFTVKEDIDKYFLTIYLSCKYGQKLKNRLVSNIATPFINKKELYGMPIPFFDKALKDVIKDTYILAVKCGKLSHKIYEQTKKLLLSELGLTNWQPQHHLTFIKNYSDIRKAERMDADYFQPKYDEIVNAIKKYSGGWDTLGNLCELVGHPSNPPYADTSDTDKIFIVTQKHLGEYSLNDEFWNDANALYTNKEFIAKNKKYILKRDDVLLYSVGAYIGKSNIYKSDIKATIGSFLTLLRAHRDILNPYYLLSFLNTDIGIMISKRHQRGMAQQYLYPYDVKNFPIPILPYPKQTKIQKKITESFNLREKSKHLLECAKQAVEIAIEKDEKKALSWLESQTKEI